MSNVGDITEQQQPHLVFRRASSSCAHNLRGLEGGKHLVELEISRIGRKRVDFERLDLIWLDRRICLDRVSHCRH